MVCQMRQMPPLRASVDVTFLLLFVGYDHWVRFNKLPPMPHQVEPRSGAHVPAMQGDGQRPLYDGALRGAGAGAVRYSAARTRLSGPALGRRRAAPRAVHQSAPRRGALQVSITASSGGRWPACGSDRSRIEFVCLQRGAFIGPGSAAGEPGRAGQMGWADPGGRACRHGGAGSDAVGAGLRPLGQPARVPHAARPQGARRGARRAAHARLAPNVAVPRHAPVHIVCINGLYFNFCCFISQTLPMSWAISWEMEYNLNKSVYLHTS